ncbi:hypothetical protein L3i23_18640 [Herbiconiux sp. L3-i23]|nr:hypothetical protein L3i23_18640 [Herbiconiux sp. L3-i23]
MGVGAAVCVVVVALVIAIVVGAVGGGRSTQVVPAPHDTGSAVTPHEQAAPPLFVHVAGAVRAPGLYELPEGARMIDAIASAGGLADDAAPDGVNLARRVADGEQITVPRVGEAPTAAVVPGEAAGGGPVSLSTATVQQLETLPRIGPAMAQRIVDWREAGGRFESVDDLLEISGFGEKTVDAVRDLVVP